MKIAIIGTGNLGLAIAKGLVTNNAITTLYLTKRNPAAIEEWAEYKNVFVTADNVEAVQKSDIIIFAVQPSQIESILESIKGELTDKHVFFPLSPVIKSTRLKLLLAQINLLFVQCQILRLL